MAEDEDEKTMCIYEIKASQNHEWKDDASLQIIIYALCCGKTWSKLTLLNPFQNSKVHYHFDTKNIMFLRKQLTNDILIYNLNSFMSKTYPITKKNKKLSVNNTMFLNIMRNENGNITQASIINMLSPIKSEIIYNKYVSSGMKKTKKMTKEQKYACESELSEEELIQELKDILHSEVNKSKVIWSFEDNCKDIIYVNPINIFYKLEKFENIVEFLEYEKNENLDYSSDLTDSLVRNIFCIAFMFLKNNFI